ncbi:hypothetical protein [Actibacterium mucosum]|nr:hypothetical protein [Actibacterium mucosum]
MNWFAATFVGVAGFAVLGVDYAVQTRSAGLTLGQLSPVAYVGTITGRADKVAALDISAEPVDDVATLAAEISQPQADLSEVAALPVEEVKGQGWEMFGESQSKPAMPRVLTLSGSNGCGAGKFCTVQK